MRPRQAFASALHFFCVMAFFLAGLFFFALPYLPEMQVRAIDFFVTHSLHIAYGFFLITFFLFLSFYGLNRGKFLRIKMGTEVSVDLIRHTIDPMLKKQFPEIHLSEIEIFRAKKLEIGVTLSAPREELLFQAEQALQTLLYHRFGYARPFYLTVKK